VTTTGITTYRFRVFVTAEGASNTVYSSVIELKVECGVNSVTASVVTDPSGVTTMTKGFGSSDPYFKISSVSNTAYPACVPTNFFYVTDSSGTDTPLTTFECDPNFSGTSDCEAEPESVGGTEFHATPVNTANPNTFSFTFKIIFTGNKVVRFDYILILGCTSTATGVTFI